MKPHAAGFACRQANEAVKLLRNGQQGFHHAPVLAPLQFEADEEAAVGDERKWMRGIDGDRRDHRQDLFKKALIGPVALAR